MNHFVSTVVIGRMGDSPTAEQASPALVDILKEWAQICQIFQFFKVSSKSVFKWQSSQLKGIQRSIICISQITKVCRADVAVDSQFPPSDLSEWHESEIRPVYHCFFDSTAQPASLNLLFWSSKWLWLSISFQFMTSNCWLSTGITNSDTSTSKAFNTNISTVLDIKC